MVLMMKKELVSDPLSAFRYLVMISMTMRICCCVLGLGIVEAGIISPGLSLISCHESWSHFYRCFDGFV